MRHKKVGWPIIVLAFAGLGGLLFYMSKTFLAEPVAIHTKPPPWIDEKTGRLKVSGSKGSGKPAAEPAEAKNDAAPKTDARGK